MTRKQLLAAICPSSRMHDCENYHCFDCNLELIKWLDEYDKHVIEQYKADTNLKDTIKEIHDNVANEMYCKGIDDFAKKLKSKCRKCYVDCDPYGSDIEEDSILYEDDIDEIAEELKAGGKNE